MQSIQEGQPHAFDTNVRSISERRLVLRRWGLGLNLELHHQHPFPLKGGGIASWCIRAAKRVTGLDWANGKSKLCRDPVGGGANTILASIAPSRIVAARSRVLRYVPELLF